MIGKDRLNLAIDPLPDLAIEVDVTSQTQVEAYNRDNINVLRAVLSSPICQF